MIAPVVLALVMALIFRSSLALMMGALGPLMVLASWWESQRTVKRDYTRECEEFEVAVVEYRDSVALARRQLRDEATRAHPSVMQWAGNPLWRQPASADTMVRIGQTFWSPPPGHPLAAEGPVSDMPGLVDSTRGLALIAGEEGRDAWWALLVQWRAHTPAGWMPRLGVDLDELPREGRGISRIVWVHSPAEVPDECAVIVVYRAGGYAEVHTPEAPPWSVRMDEITHAQAVWALRAIRGESSQDRIDEAVDTSRRDQLWMRFSDREPALDLVAQGPHAIVWGATGSGKSQTVVSMVASLAQAYTPRQLVCVVIDFKGGAGLRPLMDLPHTIGCVTDIGQTPSDRALRGLRAEIVRREKFLAEHTVTECSALDASLEFPRLVVVIDEVAWLLTNHPEWSEGLEDVLARGRSLGVHVILSTQRLAGVMSRAMMANISVRVCGRVSDAGELADWMPDAPPSLVATMRHLPPGQVVVAGAIQAATLVEVAAEPRVIAPVSPSSWRVWVEPLPSTIAWQPGQWALRERVDTQEHTPVAHPGTDGSLVILGDVGSGRSHAAHALATRSGAALLAPRDPAGLFACLQSTSGTQTLVVVDDCDVIVHAAGQEGESFLLDCLQGHEGPLVLVCSPTHRVSRQLARLATKILVMSMGKPEDRDVWGATRRHTPGAGVWEGDDVQVLYPAPAPPVWRPRCVPGALSWRELNPGDDSARWQDALRAASSEDIVLAGLSHRDVRLNSGGALWLPPVPTSEDYLWVWRGGVPHLASSADWRR